MTARCIYLKQNEKYFSSFALLEMYKDSSIIPWNSCLCHVCLSKPLEVEAVSFYKKEDERYAIYGCKECGFFLHESCAQYNLPKQWNHAFRSEHPLSLYKVESGSSEKLKCHLCGSSASKFVYHCEICKFSLDVHCVNLKPSKKLEVQAPENSHPHPLFICKRPFQVDYPCSFCNRDIYGTVYVCIHCKNILHEACSLPLEIRHEFHLEHPLSLFPRSKCPVKTPKCSACSGPDFDHAFYLCHQCNFVLDLQCAFLFPISSDSKVHHELQKQFLCHSHPLIQCKVKKQINSKQINSNCSGCNSPIKDSTFVCTKCGILLDKSCTELLPEIIHPFHPHHPLKLIENLHLNNCLQCRGCKTTNCIFTYVCSKCDFYLDPQCASTRPQMINSKIHQHPLAFLEKNLRDLRCDTCRAPCKKHFFQCIDCRFGIHRECYPLPQIIKHDCHCDPLTLTYSQIKDLPDEDSDAEFYCNACEKRRALDDPTYYCKDYASHRKRVFPCNFPWRRG